VVVNDTTAKAGDQVCVNEHIITNPRHLDLSAYPAGIYLARINGTQVVKLVKE